MIDVTLRITGSVRRLVIRPEDVVLVTLDQEDISVETAEKVKDKVQEHFPSNKVLVCGPSAEIRVMREVK